MLPLRWFRTPSIETFFGWVLGKLHITEISALGLTHTWSVTGPVKETFPTVFFTSLAPGFVILSTFPHRSICRSAFLSWSNLKPLLWRFGSVLFLSWTTLMSICVFVRYHALYEGPWALFKFPFANMLFAGDRPYEFSRILVHLVNGYARKPGQLCRVFDPVWDPILALVASSWRRALNM